MTDGKKTVDLDEQHADLISGKFRDIMEENFRVLIARNVKVVKEVFEENPENVLVSVQLEEDQIDHLARGLTGRSRRLIPITVFAELLRKLL
jgi:glycerol-3-phosphate cytidylyltransferase-like family protein